MKIVEVVWKDHYSNYGWFTVDSAEPVGHINRSVGYLTHQGEEHTTLAQTAHHDYDQVADVINILNKCIISTRELDKDEF